MKKTIAQQLNIKDFPFVIDDKNGYQVYYENSNGFWSKREYDEDGNEVYYENSRGHWAKWEFDERGNQVYYENSGGYWSKREYDEDGNEVYYENSEGCIKDKRPTEVELSMDEIASKFGIDVDKLKIKKG